MSEQGNGGYFVLCADDEARLSEVLQWIGRYEAGEAIAREYPGSWKLLMIAIMNGAVADIDLSSDLVAHCLSVIDATKFPPPPGISEWHEVIAGEQKYLVICGAMADLSVARH